MSVAAVSNSFPFWAVADLPGKNGVHERLELSRLTDIMATG